MCRLLLILHVLPLALLGQNKEPLDLEPAVTRANEVFRLAWPAAVTLLESQLAKSFTDMAEGEGVRKLRITELDLSTPPSLQLIDCPGRADCQRLRMALPGEGKWKIKVSGEILPPWQRSKTKWRKLRLTLKDLSLRQDYSLDLEANGHPSFAPIGPPELTFRLTSPNLLYKAVLAAAQKFMRSSMEEVLEESLQDLPLAELALTKVGGLQLDKMVAHLGSSLEPQDNGDLIDVDRVRFLPLNGPMLSQETVPIVEADAFSVDFLDGDLDLFADSFMAEVAVKVPPGRKVEEVTFRLGNREIARLTQPPWRTKVQTDDQSQVLLASAILDDGIAEDDYLFLEGRGHIEELEVQFVNLHLSFPTKPFNKTELGKLRPEDFRITEEGVEQLPQRLEVFMDRPLALAVVMDMSGSMEGKRLTRAREAAHSFVDQVVRPGDSMHLIAYNRTIKASKLLTEKKEMLQAVNSLRRTQDNTHTFDAVSKALDLLKGKDAVRVILLVTDGFNSGGKVSYKKLIGRLEKENVLLYTVGIDVRGRSRVALRDDFLPKSRPSMLHLRDLYDMAVVTGGYPLFVDKPSMLNKAFTVIEEELHSQLTLGYYSNLSGTHKGWRRLDVSFVPEEMPIHHKERYWKH